MRILLLGGSAWLGRCIAQAALAAQHEVTCLARGIAGDLASGCEHVRADRNAAHAYDAVSGRSWDVVLDLARQPGQVRTAAQHLGDHCQRYIFVSSVSVYAEHAQAGADESAPPLAPLASDALVNASDYGAAKRAAELHVLRALGSQRCLIVRPGLIGGPGDESDRTGYWPMRFAQAARQHAVLLPDVPHLLTQMVDARDLAHWLIAAATTGLTGVFNAVGPSISFARHIETARRVAGHHGAVVWAKPAWLAQMGVAHWAGPKSLPLWLPPDSHAGFGARSDAAARQHGLTHRPLAELMRDVLAWEQSRPVTSADRRAGLSAADEAMLLGAYGGDHRA